MGMRNYLIEGITCSGKTSVCRELLSRGYHAINGDTELAYQGDPKTGKPLEGHSHEHHIWDVAKVRTAVSNKSHSATFFCGGSRNFADFIELFDRVFVLDIDLATLNRRLSARTASEWGAREAERQIVRRLHATKEDLPRGGILIDSTAPVARVVEELLQKL
jgi:broad-specificity NMP kinase